MPQTNALFTATDLSNLLHKAVSDDAADVAERVVWGWLAPILAAQGIADRPANPSDQLKAWALELGAIVYENPASLVRKQAGPFLDIFDVKRRDEILDQVVNGGTTPAGAVPAPRGGFPLAHRYPDPARRYPPAEIYYGS